MSRNSGGVLLYVKQSLSPKRLRAGISHSLCLVAADVTFLRQSFIVATSYRSPNQSAQIRDNYLTNLQDFLASLGSRISSTVLTGDFNFCALDLHDFSPLSGITSSFGLQQLISQPTHLKRALDLIFVGQSVPVFHSGLCTPVEKNHCTVWLQFHGLPGKTAPRRRICAWRWADADWIRAHFLLNYLPDGTPRSLTEEVSSQPSVTDAVSYLNQTLLSVLNLCVPHRFRCIRGKSVPWFSAAIAKLIRKRDRAFCLARQFPDPSNWAKFKRLRKAVKVSIIDAKKQHLSTAFEDVDCPSKFWRAVKSVIDVPVSLPSLVNPNGGFAVGSADKAQLLGDYFTSTFNHHDCLPPNFPSDLLVEDHWICQPKFILEQLKTLPQSPHAGLDLLPCHLLSACADSLAEPIAAILNRCLADGDFPKPWKMARIAAIPKSAGANSADKFRPISVLPVLARVAERWLLAILSPYARLSPFQFGNLRKRSTEDALAFLQHTVASGFAECHGFSTKVAAVSVDVSKAYDSVPHNVLFARLLKLGFLPTLVQLLRSYFADRQQVVRVDSDCSRPQPVVSGVVQGSVIGPFLFSAYVDGILRLPFSCCTTPIMYVDDLILLKPIPTREAEMEFQHDLDTVLATYSDLFLSVNPKKSQLFLFSISSHLPQTSTTLCFDGIPIPVSGELKYLGFVLDRRLNFSANAAAMESRAKKAIGCLHRAFGGVGGSRVFERIYQHKIIPMYLYGLPVSAPSSVCAFARLERIQRFAARLIANDYLSSYHELLYRLNWKSIGRLCFERRSILAHKYLHNLRHLPSDAVSVCVNYGRCSERLCAKRAHSLQFLLPYSCLSTVDKFPIYQLFKTWNALPECLALCESPVLFKKLVCSPVVYASVQSRIPDSLLFIDNL